jgi:hypothetical protein
MARPKALELSTEYPNRLLGMIPQVEQEGFFTCVRAWVAMIPPLSAYWLYLPYLYCTVTSREAPADFLPTCRTPSTLDSKHVLYPISRQCLLSWQYASLLGACYHCCRSRGCPRDGQGASSKSQKLSEKTLNLLERALPGT